MSWNIKTPGDYINGPLTVVGDVTVGSNAFRVDTVNKRIGVNIANPAAPAHIYASGSDTASVRMQAAGGRTFDIGSTASGYGSANNFIIFDVTAGAERIRVDASGNTGFGGAPSAKLHAFVAPPAAGSDGLRIGDGTRIAQFAITGSSYNYKTVGALQPFIYGFGGPMNILADGDEIKLITGTGYKTHLNATGMVALHGGNAAANGIGIAFPAAQSASTDANTLDDYEEGTFTPTVVGNTTAGTATYSAQTGKYTKVGRLVTFNLRVTYTGGTGAGFLRIAGLPFATGDVANYSVYAENISLTAGNYPVVASASGVTSIGIDQLPTGGGAANSVAYDAAGDIWISGSYIV